MAQTPNDPAGTTHQFQNFQNRGQAEKSSGPNMALIIGVLAVVAVVVIAVAALLMM
ncbi:hypothetical protein [Actinomadura terrae]|uniref:hypothetical protein n=1 Tax=Actinomadura terrae TaxID=604353 RepID=UPI001FA80FC9|nr:hypothetical protein [Actinomadura terrae]